MNYAEIVYRVKKFLVEPISADTEEYIPEALADAQKMLEDEKIFRCTHGFGSDKTDVHGLSGLVGLFTAPADYNGLRNAYRPYWLTGDDSTVWMELLEYSEELFRRIGGGWTDVKGPPEFILPLEVSGISYIMIYPIPDGENDTVDGEYTIKYAYWKSLAALSETNSTNWFSENCHDFLIKKTTSECFLFDEDFSHHLIWEQRAETARKKLVRRERRGQFHADTLVPKTDANASAKQGRV